MVESDITESYRTGWTQTRDLKGRREVGALVSESALMSRPVSNLSLKAEDEAD